MTTDHATPFRVGDALRYIGPPQILLKPGQVVYVNQPSCIVGKLGTCSLVDFRPPAAYTDAPHDDLYVADAHLQPLRAAPGLETTP